MTKERFAKILELVDKWNDKEQAGKDFPDAMPALTVSTEGDNPELFRRAAKEMCVSEEELHDWFEQEVCRCVGDDAPDSRLPADQDLDIVT